MAIEEMILLNMTFDRQDLDQVLFNLKSSRYFYPQSASKIVNNVKGVHALQEDNVYAKMLDRLIQIGSDMKLDLTRELAPEYSLNINKTDEYLKNVEGEIKKIKDIQDELVLVKDENEKTLDMLNHLHFSEIDLDQIAECQYVTVRFGRFRRQNLDKIKYYEGRPFIFNKLGEDHQYVWCCYVVTHNLKLEVDNIFSALGFEEIEIPSFVHGTIDGAKKELEEEIHAMQEYILRMDQKLTVFRETHKVDLLKLYSTAYFLQRIESYKVFVVDYQSKCAIYGFIPKNKISEFKELHNNISSIEYQELPANILENQQIVAPTVVNNIRIVRPFEMLSKVKQSDKIDTTLAVAVLYYLVFIIFLGDLGLGAILVILGMLLKKKKVGSLFLALGVASCIGGLMYGDVFYTISLYPAIALPISAIFKIIDGIVLLIAGTFSISAFKKMYIQESKVEKVLSIKGICGLICVFALLVYMGCAYEAHLNIPFMPFAIVIVACLVMVLAKYIKKKRATK